MIHDLLIFDTVLIYSSAEYQPWSPRISTGSFDDGASILQTNPPIVDIVK
jgi:hypothetical protein